MTAVSGAIPLEGNVMEDFFSNSHYERNNWIKQNRNVVSVWEKWKEKKVNLMKKEMKRYYHVLFDEYIV